MSVIILPEVLQYLDDLVFILFQKQYFSYLDTSIEYIDDLIEDIKNNLPAKRKRPAPEYFIRFVANLEQAANMQYAVFKKNKRTSWYVFFTTYEDEQTGDDIFLIRYISNNHMIAQHL